MTALIAFLPSRETSATSDTGAKRPADQGQAWLKAMEDNGLGDALRHTRRYLASDFEAGKTPSRQQAPYLTRPATNAVPTDSSEPASIGLPAAEEASTTPGFVAPFLGQGTALAAGALPLCAGSFVPADIPAIASTELPATPVNVSTTSAKTWSERHVLVLPAVGDGLEVWVRDAKLSGTRMQMLLADLQRTATESGKGPVQLFLNGRPVTSADHPYIRQGER